MTLLCLFKPLLKTSILAQLGWARFGDIGSRHLLWRIWYEIDFKVVIYENIVVGAVGATIRIVTVTVQDPISSAVEVLALAAIKSIHW